jgi:isopenicillin-N N-acyltransferase-like protein
VTEDDLVALLRDHQSAPSAICRHVDERDPVPLRSETVYSVVLDLDDRRFGLAEGPPCGHEYGWLPLDDGQQTERSAGAAVDLRP